MFRNIDNYRPCSSSKVYEPTVETSIVVEGSVELHNQVVSNRDVTDPDIISKLPSVEEFSLKNRLAAGVGLEEVATEVLTPTGVVSINTIADQVINKINSQLNQEN